MVGILSTGSSPKWFLPFTSSRLKFCIHFSSLRRVPHVTTIPSPFIWSYQGMVKSRAPHFAVSRASRYFASLMTNVTFQFDKTENRIAEYIHSRCGRDLQVPGIYKRTTICANFMDWCGLLSERGWTFVYINRGNITHSVSCGTQGGPCLLCQYPWRKTAATVHRGYTVFSGTKDHRNSNFIKSIKIGQRAKTDLMIQKHITQINKNDIARKCIVNGPVSGKRVVLKQKQISNQLPAKVLWSFGCTSFHSRLVISNSI
jgi:hypothetical protein